jgi:hypothetical protein
MAKKNAAKEQLELLSKAQSAAKAMGASEETIIQLQKDILDGHLKTYDALKQELSIINDIVKVQKEALKVQEEQKKVQEEQQKAQEKQKKAQEDFVSLEQDLAKAYNSLKKSKYEIAAQSDEEFDATKKIVDAKRAELKVLQESGSIDADRIESLQNVINKMQGVVDVAEELRNKFGTTTLSTINEGFDNLQSKINKVTSFLPKGISKALGIDTMADDLKDAVLSGKKLSPKFMFGGALIAGAALFEVMQDITKQSKDFSKQTGLSVAASQRLVEQSISLQASFDNQLSSQKDILAVQQEIVSQLGPMAQLSGEVALQVSETGNAFGYGAENAAKVQAQMMQINGMSEEAAANAQDFTAQLALAEGVAPGKVMEDIAKSSRVANKYFFGNAEELGKAAVEAQKMGLSLEDMAKTSEALLNIEESLTNQYQLSAMLGRQVNLDKARQLAAEGKIAEATKETIKALGGIQEFENASVFEKERMAAAAGMTVDQLGKSLAIQEKMTNATEEELAAMNGLNLSASQIKNMSAEELKTKLAQRQATEQLSTSMEQIKSTLISGIMPIAKGLVPIFTIISYIVKGILLPFTLLSELSTKIGETLGGWAKALGPFGIIIKTIAGIGILLAAYGAFLSLSWIPVVGAGLGAIAAAAVMSAGFSALNSVGDLAMPAAGDGPIVASPSEGTIFQGTKNDEVAMGPGVIGSAQNNGNGTTVNTTTVSIDYDKLAEAVTRSIEKLRIIIDESAVNAIAQKGAVRASFK